MNFAQIQGNDDVRAALAGMVDSGRIPHAIMLHEDDGGDGLAIALAFLQYLYCSDRTDGDSCGVCPHCNKISKLIHPDVHFVFPTASGCTSDQFAAQWRGLLEGGLSFTEGKFRDALGLAGKPLMIAVSEANSLLQTLNLSALEGGWRSVVLYLPELLNQESANKLLKMIEEPPAMTQFLLVTHAPDKVLPTIASRCQRIRVKPSGRPGRRAEESDAQYSELLGSMLDAVFSHDLLSALEAGEAVAALPSRESARAFCKFASDTLREIFLRQQGLASIACPDNAFADRYAARCSKTFPRKAAEGFDRAWMMVGRNVNAKIVFTDLVNRLYILK